MNYRNIAEKIRNGIGPKIDRISSLIVPVSSDLQSRYNAAKSQEKFIYDVFTKRWNPEFFTMPTNSVENAYCGDIIIKGFDRKPKLGLDVKFPSTNSNKFSPPDFASILFLTTPKEKLPRKVVASIFPKHRLIMTFNKNGDFKFLDPHEILDALFSHKATLKASYHRGHGTQYPDEFLREVASYREKINVIDGDGKLFPEDFLYFTSQNRLMF